MLIVTKYKENEYNKNIHKEGLIKQQIDEYQKLRDAKIALAIQKENHETGNKFIGYVAMAKQLTAWRNSEEIA